MANVRELAELVATEFRLIMEAYLRNVRPPFDDRSCSTLAEMHYHLGLADGILSESPVPMVAAFTESIRYWFMRPNPPYVIDSLQGLETIILTGNREFYRRAIESIRPTPLVRQDRPEHHIASLLLVLMGGPGETESHRAFLKGVTGEYAGYGQMLVGLLDGDAAAVAAGAATYLKWFQRAATKGVLKDLLGDNLAATPVLCGLRLARERGLAVSLQVESPYLLPALIG
jgi:hypothetical protein